MPLAMGRPIRPDAYGQKETREKLAPRCPRGAVFVLQRQRVTAVHRHAGSWAGHALGLTGINPEPPIYCAAECRGEEFLPQEFLSS